MQFYRGTQQLQEFFCLKNLQLSSANSAACMHVFDDFPATMTFVQLLRFHFGLNNFCLYLLINTVLKNEKIIECIQSKLHVPSNVPVRSIKSIRKGDYES